MEALILQQQQHFQLRARQLLAAAEEETKRVLENPERRAELPGRLYRACLARDALFVRHFLDSPYNHVNVNTRNYYDQTAFFHACEFGRTRIAKLLLQDPRVDVNRVDFLGRTPLSVAANNGFILIIWWTLFLRTDVNLANIVLWGHSSNGSYETCGLLGETEDLLRVYESHQPLARHEIGLRLRMGEYRAAELYASIVFYSDEYLQLREGAVVSGAIGATIGKENEEAVKASQRARFFEITRRLPMELQMIVALRGYGSARDNILSSQSDPAFMSVARKISSAKAARETQ